MAEPVNSDIIVTAVQFWQKVFTEKTVTVRFVTKDNRDRIMRCTLDFTKIPEKDHPKTVNIEKILKLIQQNQIMHVYDLDIKAWRSVPFARVEYLQTQRGKRFYVKPTV